MRLGPAAVRKHATEGRDPAKLSDGQARAIEKTITSQKFLWGAGIECSFIPHLKVDQFEWTQHDQFWKDDFSRAKQELGLSHLRYALPWHRLEPARGHFQWAAADERIEFCDRLGLELCLDVMHFGTPPWLLQAAGDPEFPEALEQFSEAIVNRYRSSVKTWCPCNEPSILCLFSGDFGFWPPHARKWRGFMPVVSRVVQGVSRSIRAIRRAMPEASVLLCEHIESYRSSDEKLEAETRFRNLRRFLLLDLLQGRVDRRHPLHHWVTAYGISDLDLEWFRSNPQSPDVIGLDYYSNSEWQLESIAGKTHQRHSESPAGIYGIGWEYYSRYRLPMMVTETSINGKPINREIWLEETVEDCRRLRADGVPVQGYFWWPLIDQVDWDGALTHRVGKIHEVGLFSLRREADGTLSRHATPLVAQLKAMISAGDQRVGDLKSIVIPSDESQQEPPIEFQKESTRFEFAAAKLPENSNGNGRTKTEVAAIKDISASGSAGAGQYGIVVFSHLRWGFVWQRPQQFLSRFARKHRILFVEEPRFDLAADEQSRLDYHQVMPNVTVITPHFNRSWIGNRRLPRELRAMTREAMGRLNDKGHFEKPLLWYYSPMDASWSLGHFDNSGVVYDCMDELSQFTGAPKALVRNEARLLEYADVVFAGGFELGDKKRAQHDNVHTFGCGVEYDHFARAADGGTVVPPDIDFMARPIIGWMGVVDERVDYVMVGEIAREKPDWSLAMIGPVVKVDPNLLPHSPNLFWMGGREYQSLPNYCRAFDVCMMPFAMNRSTQFINPTKALEYMATGKPIVSTPVRDVVRQWSDIVRVAENRAEFIAGIDAALKSGTSDQRIARGIELARQSSWDATVGRLQDLIAEAISKKNRRSAKNPVPLDDVELEYVYASTQGS